MTLLTNLIASVSINHFPEAHRTHATPASVLALLHGGKIGIQISVDIGGTHVLVPDFDTSVIQPTLVSTSEMILSYFFFSSKEEKDSLEWKLASSKLGRQTLLVLTHAKDVKVGRAHLFNPASGGVRLFLVRVETSILETSTC